MQNNIPQRSARINLLLPLSVHRSELKEKQHILDGLKGKCSNLTIEWPYLDFWGIWPLQPQVVNNSELRLEADKWFECTENKVYQQIVTHSVSSLNLRDERWYSIAFKSVLKRIYSLLLNLLGLITVKPLTNAFCHRRSYPLANDS